MWTGTSITGVLRCCTFEVRKIWKKSHHSSIKDSKGSVDPEVLDESKKFSKCESVKSEMIEKEQAAKKLPRSASYSCVAPAGPTLIDAITE